MERKSSSVIGRHIAAARKQAGLTQEELADRLHVTRQTISNYESMRSQPDIQMLVQLADCLQVPVEELIYGRGAKRPARAFGGLATCCRNLGIAVYVVGALWGIYLGSGAVSVGENQVAYGFSLWEAIPIWAAALIHGTILLALGILLTRFSFQQVGSREESE